MTHRSTNWHTARTLAHAVAQPLPPEDVALHHAIHRRTAATIVSLTSLPPHDASAMDGWAVHGAGPWRIVGRARAGAPWQRELLPGEAVEISTGAVMPIGATAVLRHEDAELIVGELSGNVRPGDHIRRAGEECAAEEILLPAGSILGPAHLGLLAAAGHDTVTVVRQPRAVVLVLGDELLSAGPARDGRVRDSLGIQVPAWLAAWGCETTAVISVGDARDELARCLKECEGADIVVTTGGTASGQADHLHSVFAEIGGAFVVDGVHSRPGHPMLLGTWEERILVGLPGNPHAAVAALATLVQPLLLGMHSAPLESLDLVSLGAPVATRGGATRLVPSQLRDLVATPCEHIGSGMLRGLASADGFAVVTDGGAAGQLVEWLPLPWST